MGFFGSILGAAVKTVSLPIAAVVDIATLGEADLTKNTAESALDDLEEAFFG